MEKSNLNLKKELPMPKPSLIHSEKFRVGIGSAAAAIVTLFLSFYLSEFSETTATRDVGVVFGILIGVVPLTLLQVKEVQRKDSIDRNMPLFLLALLSSVQSGSNLIRALEHSAERNPDANCSSYVLSSPDPIYQWSTFWGLLEWSSPNSS